MKAYVLKKIVHDMQNTSIQKSQILQMSIYKKIHEQIVICLCNGILTVVRMSAAGKDLEELEPLHIAGMMEDGAVSVESSLVTL